jgi:protein involved in polysaccharide export with SLBB domain
MSPSGLPYFGYDVFSGVPAAFEPTASGPVDPEYVIGPDDILRVTVWGQVEFQNELRIDKEGRVFVPTVGQILVSGLTLEKATTTLIRQMSRSYSGLVSRPPTVWLDLTLARLRPKRVFMMGEVFKPGGYTVSSYANVFNSLYSIGGPTVNGSMRDIRVIRDNKIIARVDLYKYLTGADETDDIRVQNNDIVFVPSRGKSVSIHGEVGRPAVYELLEGENLRSLLRYCGGLSPTAYTLKAQIVRVKPFEQRKGEIEDRIVMDISPGELLAGTTKDVTLYTSDDITVFPVLDEMKNFVSIQGAVWRPGRYELGQIRTIKQLIDAAKGVQPKAYLEYGHVIRLNADLITRRIIPFEVEQVLYDRTADRQLKPRDEVIIYSIEALEVKEKMVTLHGEVKKPGRYPLRMGMTLEDLVLMAGGYTEAAEMLQAEVARMKPEGLGGDSLAIILHPVLPDGFAAADRADLFDSANVSDPRRGEQFFLAHRDQVLIRPNPNFRPQKEVAVEGDFTYPGIYSIQRRGETVSDILTRAGGPTRTSYLGGGQLLRAGSRVLLDLRMAYTKRDEEHDIEVMAGDRIVVPSRPHTVAVSGEVNKPGLLIYEEGDNVSDYIDRAGGLTDSANYAVLTQPSGESRRVNFGFLRGDPAVEEGASIFVSKVPPPIEKEGVDVASTVKDVFAILSAAATIAFIVWQTSR